MNILHISQFDRAGGAEQIAWNLHRACLDEGHNSHMLVGWKRTEQPYVTSLVPGKEHYLAWWACRVLHYLERRTGVQALGSWMVGRWWRKHGLRWDVIHLNNLHGSYFDLGVLPRLTHHAKVVITLHDCWLFTGHCAHPGYCKRWKTGCGDCPDLGTYPGIERDSTHFNWRRKQRILQEARPTLVVPSQWLGEMVAESPMARGLRCEVIHNGVDTKRFRPGNRRRTKEILGFPQDKLVLLYVANRGLNSTWHKDPELLLSAMEHLIADGMGDRIHLVVVGGRKSLPSALDAHVTQLGDMRKGLETVYQAADVAVYPTKADNCPLVPLEAMSSGLPIISTAVGGVPELIIDGKTGYLVMSKDADGFVEAIKHCLNPDKRAKLGRAARQRAELKFSLQRMIRQYMDLYREIPR